MIHCSAFCVAIGEGASELLEKNIRFVDRHRRGILVDTGAGFEEFNGRIPKSSRALAVFTLDAGDPELPAVHGFYTEAADYPKGEFSFLVRSGDTFNVGRDVVGTRPLFYHKGSMVVAASDHRFLRGLKESRLLEPGESLDLGAGLSTSHSGSRTEPPSSRDEAAARLARELDFSVKRRTDGKRRVAISFSGGLDSSILAHCAAKYVDVILCSVFTKGSRDEGAAGRAAAALGLDLVRVEGHESEIQQELRLMDLPFSPTPMDRALWTIYSISARLARMNCAETILLGQLADELFGGYRKYETAMTSGGKDRAESMMLEDLAACGRRGLIRDEQACSRWVEPTFPFADEGVVALGLSAGAKLKMAGGERKVMLRDAAKNLGLPTEIVESPKKAAQYSSGVGKLVAQQVHPF